MNHAESAYGLWWLVIINSAIFIMFAFSFFKPTTARDLAARSCAASPAPDQAARGRPRPGQGSAQPGSDTRREPAAD